MSEFKTIRVKIKGTAPLLLNNGRQADPLWDIMIQLKELTSIKNKTPEIHRKIADLSWRACLYVDQDERVIMPGINFEASIRNGAKKSKLGKSIQAGLMVVNDALIQYDGSKDINVLVSDERFRLTCGVKQQNKRLMKTRPLFSNWACEYIIRYNPDLLTEKQVEKSIVDAGLYCGLGDWLPRYGRYEIVETGNIQ
jgi:hypothetical protein